MRTPTDSRRLTYVWAALSAITAVKSRLIIRHFMEVRTAPRWLKVFTDVWLAALVATIAALYLQ